MNKWVSVKDGTPMLYDFYQVINKKGFVNWAVNLIGNECDGTREDKYFAEIECVRFENGRYECEDIGAEILDVTHFSKLPTKFDDE